MDPLVATVAVLWASAHLLARWLEARRARDNETTQRTVDWTSAAREAGLAGIEATPGSLRGSAGSLQLALSRRERDTMRTCVEIRSPRLPIDLWLRPEASATPSRSPKEVELGDEEFDREVSVQGPPALALALLDAPVRGALLSLMRRRPFTAYPQPAARFDAGVLLVDVPEEVPGLRLVSLSPARDGLPPSFAHLDGRHTLPELLRAALALAQRLTTPDDLAARLAARLAAEPEPGVRLQILLALIREFPAQPSAREAVAAARDDPDAEVRLRAALALGTQGHEVLLALASGEGAPDDTCARAVAGLAGILTAEQASDLLANAAYTQREATARECARVLGRRGGPVAVRALTELLASASPPCDASPTLAIEAVRALGEAGEASVEPALLAALRSPSGPLAIAAARALGRIGSARAVMPLREAEERDAGLRGAARQAVAEIQTRLRGAAPGQLSLAHTEAGALSIVEEREAGRLSLSDDPRLPTADERPARRTP